MYEILCMSVYYVQWERRIAGSWAYTTSTNLWARVECATQTAAPYALSLHYEPFIRSAIYARAFRPENRK